MTDTNIDNKDLQFSDEDIRMDFELRCAAQQDNLPDAEKEWKEFRSNRLKENREKSHNSSVKFKVLAVAVAVAACLLLLLMPYWERDSKDEQPSENALMYVSPPPMDGIALSVGDKEVAIGSQEARSKGVVMSDDSVIQFLTSENVAAENRNTITIPQGQVARIQLPDGTRVSLSARSRLIFPHRFLANAPREVYLSGEGYFEVARDESRPFIVHSGLVSTRVLGTTFNIRSYEGEMPQVTLVSGSVLCKVKSPKTQGSSAKPQEMVLKPGQQLVVLNSQVSVNKVDTDEVTSWKDGYFCFGKQTLKDVLIEIARWYNVNVTFVNEEHIGDYVHYNGERSWSIQKVVDQLNAICETKIIYENQTLTVN